MTSRKIPLPSEQEGTTSTLEEEFKAEAEGKRITYPLPWSRLNTITPALRPGSVIIIAGPAGHGKTYFAMQIAVHMHAHSADFTYLILEDRKVDFERRLLAHLSGDWSVIENDQNKADRRLEIISKYRHELADLAEHIPENPRLPIIGDDGNPTVPPLPYQEVLDWVTRAVQTSRLVIIDPIAQIDFGGPQEWRGQADFMRQITGLAAHYKASIILVAHTAKRGGRAGAIPLTGEDIQGAAEIKRLSHTILLLDAHDEKESTVWRVGGMREVIRHDRTVIVDKARNGSGKGNRMAFVMDGPAFRELGVIAPKEKASVSGSGQPSDRAYKE